MLVGVGKQSLKRSANQKMAWSVHGWSFLRIRVNGKQWSVVEYCFHLNDYQVKLRKGEAMWAHYLL